uniref:Uncharacterized protein n=1 Tax=Timema cristinae TaxID=61476 RepID=A0A7R9C8N0_TIMCR|nr:unnamed protein product [Timema cristinae]
MDLFVWSVDDVDMYTGMLSEFPVEGGVLGPTVSCLITDQFLRLKFGDRFWYETPQQPQAFTPGKYSEHVNNDRQLDEIRKTTLAGLICDTSDSVEQLQPYVMRSTKTDNTPVKCSSVPRPNLSLWKETDGEFVKTGSTRLKLGASVAVPQVIKAVPKTIRIGARVTGGSITMNSGTWKPTFPVTIPVSPFDAIATSDEVPSVEAPTYGHSIVWRGTLSEISPSGDLTISATFSLPKYVHGTNLFFIEWLNGNIQFHLNTIWNATGKSLLPATGLFSSSVHFKDTWKYSYLKDVDPWLFEPSLSLKNDFSANPNVVLEPKTGCAVIILLGSYSSDRSLFLWSGELTLVLSPATEEIAMPTSSKLFVKQSNVNSLTDAIPSTTRVVAAVTGGSVSTISGSWTSTFPVGIPVYPFNDVASSYIADALADTTLPVYGHGIIWQGTVLKPSSSDTLQVSGSFSLPRFMHGDPSTFSIQWLNGDFTFQLQPLYNITGLDSLPITDVFSSSVYFQERKEYAYLKNLPPPSSGSLPVSFTSTPSVVGGPDVRHAPIIMLGTYSLDRSIFWWSGNASLYVKNKILPMTSQVSWSEKNKESVNAKLSNLNEGASSSDLQEIEPIPKTLTLSAKVMGGSFTTNSGTWKSNFPVTLPVISFDAISKTDEVPAVKPLTYGHGILWRGTLSEILPSGDLTLSATFSLPRYVHGPEIFDMEWLNGNIQLQLHTLSNVTGKNLLPVNGLFYSSVHFKETWQYSYLKDVDPLLFEPNLSLKNDFSVNPDIVYEPKTGQGVIILLGTYTSDHSSFIWSGDLTLVLSTATEEIAMPTSSKLFVKQSNVNSLTDAIPSTTRVVAAVTGGSVSTSSGSWTSTFPVGIPVYPFNDVASSYIADALADTTLPVYGHGIIWQGTVSKPSSSDTLQVSGSFSLPSWTSTFPVGIPVYPFNDVASSYIADALADTTLPVYGHGIIWQGTVSKPSSSDTLQVSGSFSLPRFMHGDPSTFSIQWLNGDFTFQLQPLYNITGLDSLPITDVFSSSVYFQERKEYAYLKNLPPPSSGSLPVSFTSTPSVVGGPDVRHAPLVLLGAYSLDESVFWWSGKTSLYIRNKIPSFIKQDYSSNVKSIKKTNENNIGLPVLKDSVKNTEVAVSLKVKSGEMSAYLKNESEPEFKWDGNLPLNIPYPLFDKQLLTASDTLVTPVMGQGIIWSANLSNNFTSGDRLNGEFSFTRYVHGNISSTSAVEFWRGSFTFDIDLATNTSLEGLVNPDITFTSPVYFTSTPVVPITTTLFSSETAASTQAPIILEGNFSSDRSFFLWTGDAKLIIPTMKLLESSAKSVTKVSVGAEVTSGNISVSGTNVWSGSLPVPIPVLKTKPLSSGTPIFGNKISWSGNLVTNSSEEVKFTGTFSSQNLTGGLPLSGDFSFDLSLLWNTTVNGLVKPSSVYSSIIILKDMKASQSTKQVLSSTPMSVGVSDSLIPIILKGSYSPDNTIFYWSGNAIISFPK